MATLKELLENLTEYQFSGDSREIEISGIAYDSRRVKPGNIFVCIQGFKQDGHEFIADAIENGAQVVVIEKELALKSGITYIKVEDSRLALAKLSEVYYGYPLDELDLIGVTGTNGKTTTTYMIESILSQAEYKTGLIGTISNKIVDQFLPTERTTPESLDLHQLFQKMVLSGVTHTVMEVSSHALELKRVQDFCFRVAVFTNITQDHLDFHESLENYKVTKGKLFKQLHPDGVGVINLDDAAGEYMLKQCRGKVITYGIKTEADVRASEIDVKIDRVAYLVTTPHGEMRVNLNFSGYFNVYNSLAAISTGLAFNLPLEVIKSGLENLPLVAGRFEQVKYGQDFGVIVDYAHTPDGVKNVLQSAKIIAQKRIIAVFGCGGDRDRTKRPLMGKIAAELADLCILTSDNPRTEDPVQILKDVEKGVQELVDQNAYLMIPDRREAIFRAVQEAQTDDLVIIMGKGHETYQVINDQTIVFDDREIAKEAILSL